MNDVPPWVGVTWHEGTWVAVALDRDGGVDAIASAELGSLWSRYEDVAERIVVGVPVGLVETDDPERACDALAREYLGARADAIVTPPSREASRRRRFPAARRVHERTTGGELSEAAFALAPAIAALDELLQEVPDARAVVRGSHPELAFRGFATAPLEHRPSKAGGYAERMRILAEFDPEAPPAVQSAAEAVGDAPVPVRTVLDAVALGYVARPGAGELYSLPREPPTDATGLPMELVYRAADRLDG